MWCSVWSRVPDMTLQLAHMTDKGVMRTSNQDSFCARISNFGDRTVAMLAVCDGVGGLQSGELASTGAVRCFENWFEQQLPELVRAGLTENSIFLSWHEMLEQLHKMLSSYAEKTGVQLGTTVSAVLLTQDRLYLVQVGDSRIYLEDGTALHQLTKDQTLAVQEMEAGRISPEEAQVDQRSSILLQCLGYGRVEPVFQSTERPQKGTVLLCSDGFCHKLTKAQMHQILTAPKTRDQLQQQLQEAVAFCRSSGETDNITALVLRWDNRDDLPSDSKEWVEVWARLSGEAVPEEYDRKLGESM